LAPARQTTQARSDAIGSGRQVRGIRHVDLRDLQLASSETARRINRDIILELIRAGQPISRADLARRSGLQRSTVSQIVEQLIRERWVREGPVASAPRGRRPTMIGLNEDLAAIAVDIHPGRASIAVVDLNGQIHSRTLAPLTSDPVASTQALVNAMEELLGAVTGKSIEGIGISVPGRVDPGSERMIFAPNLHWRDFDLKKKIEARFGLPVKLENAATACLLAELTFARLDGIRDAVLITVSEGVGAGIFANGQLISGSGGLAGEFGHIPLDPSGPRCSCGQKGCWETLASSRAALRYYREMKAKEKVTSFEDLIRNAAEGNAAASKALTMQATAIGRGLRMIIASLSPAVILIAGDITTDWQRFGPIIEKEASRLTLAGAAPRIRPTNASEIARLRGAAALVFQRPRASERGCVPAFDAAGVHAGPA
jgi:predicted NBD/HSP70 family sugar kinase